MATNEIKVLPPAGSVTADELRALPEGTLIVTYGVGWGKTGADEWRTPFRLYDNIRDSEWLSKVATMIVFNPKEWGL